MAMAWYEEYYGEEFLTIYDIAEEQTRKEIEFLQRVIATPPPARILDLGCSYGRHAIPLAQRGYTVTGVDISPHLLQKARALAEKEGLRIDFIRQEMKELSFEECFDVVASIGTALGCYEETEEDQEVLERVSRALRDGGKFILETANLPWFFRNFRPSEWLTGNGGTLVLKRREFDIRKSRRNEWITMIKEDGKKTEHYWSLRYYSCPELERMLAQVNLKVLQVLGDFDASPYTLNSQRTIVVCEKSCSEGKAGRG